MAQFFQKGHRSFLHGRKNNMHLEIGVNGGRASLPEETQMIEMKLSEMLFQAFLIPEKQCQGKHGVQLIVHKNNHDFFNGWPNRNGNEIDVATFFDEFNCSSC